MKRLLFIAIAVVMIVQLAACGSSSNKSSVNQEEKSVKQKENEEKQETAKQVNLRYSWWGSDVRNKAILSAIDEYEKLNPHVRIEGEIGTFSSYYQKLITQLAGNTAPDIITIDNKWVEDLASKGKPFVDMNTMKNTIDISGLNMDYVNKQMMRNNYLLGLPLSVNAKGLLYNKKMLEESGIDINNNWDWDTVMEAGKKLHESDNSKHLMFLIGNEFIYVLKTQIKQKTGNNIINDDYSLGFTKQQLVDVFTYFRDMIDNGVIPPFEISVQYENVYADQIPGWLNSKYAIFPTTASLIPSVEKASEFEVDVARYPIFKDAEEAGIFTPLAIIVSINANSEHIDESAKFLNWLLNEKEAAEILKDANGMPSVQSTVNLLKEQGQINNNITKMIDQAMPFAATPENELSLNPEIVTIISNYVHQLGFNKMTPEQAADALIEDVTSKLEELKKK